MQRNWPLHRDAALTLVNTSGISMVDSDGAEGTLLFTGTQSAINAVLAKGVTYTPDTGFNGEATLTLGANDGSGSSTAQVVIAVTHAVNGTTGNDTLSGTAGYDTIDRGAGS